MATPTFFTVEADYKSVVGDSTNDLDSDPDLGPVTATVTFTPMLKDGDVILATTATPRPTGFVAAPIPARIDTDGRLKVRVDPDKDVLTFPNLAGFPGTGNTTKMYVAADTQLAYSWSGSAYVVADNYVPVRLLADTPLLELAGDLWYTVTFTNVQYNGKKGTINSFAFQAPNIDTVINLITVTPGPGQTASGVTKIAPGGVRRVGNTLVFTFAGVDLPDPIDLTGIAGGGGGGNVAADTHAAPAKTAPVDADELPVVDSAATNTLKKVTFGNLKAWVKSWIAKGDVGLGNVDNTSDASKPVSTAQAAADALKAPIASPTFTGTVSGVTKAMVGLGNVDNTADTAKPISTAQQTALDGKQPIDSDLTAIAALTTTAYGRSLLALADAATALTALEAGNAANTGSTIIRSVSLLAPTAANSDFNFPARARGYDPGRKRCTIRNIGTNSFDIGYGVGDNTDLNNPGGGQFLTTQRIATGQEWVDYSERPIFIRPVTTDADLFARIETELGVS